MARIDFAFGADDRLRTACQVIRKHCLMGRPLVIYTADTALLDRFDALLWSFEPTAFVPHLRVGDPLAPATLVQLTSQPPVPPEPVGNTLGAWLVNLDVRCPPNAGQFERVLEIISANVDERRLARERWRQYKADGHNVHAHDMASGNQAAGDPSNG